MRNPHESESRHQGCSTHTKRVLAAACVGILIVTLAACVRPQPPQDAVLDEGYLAYPSATKIEEEFYRGLRGGWNPEGQGETPDPSYLGMTYELDRPTPPQDILTWYEDQLKAKGWTIEGRGLSRSSTDTEKLYESTAHLHKQVGDQGHSIEIVPLVPGSDSKFDPYDSPEEGEARRRRFLASSVR